MGIQGFSLMRSFWSISFLLFSLHQLPNTNAGRLGNFDAIYQFGDSISDTGNFIRLNANFNACSTLPYGQTYFGFPTGRCCDGLLMVDFISRQLGLPFVKPYLDETADFSKGVDFAIVGASTLSAAELKANNVTVLVANASLPVELGWFRTHLQSICTSPSKSCQARVKRSLFIMGEIGGNDINFSFFGGNSFQFVYNLIPTVVLAIKNAVQEVIDVGARNILIPGNFPIGCIPIYRNVFASNDTSNYDDFKCLKRFNQVVKFQNERIQKAIIELQDKNPHVRIAYVDLYNAYKWLIVNYASLGFEEDEAFNPCCGSASHNCGRAGSYTTVSIISSTMVCLSNSWMSLMIDEISQGTFHVCLRLLITTKLSPSTTKCLSPIPTTAFTPSRTAKASTWRDYRRQFYHFWHSGFGMHDCE